MSLHVERQPFDLATLPQNLQKHLASDAPAQLKMMAARGMLPVAPVDNVRALYQLHFDADEKIKGASRTSLAELPADILRPIVPQLEHSGTLDWIAEVRGDDRAILEAVVANRATDDRTIARLARRSGSALCDVIAANQVRLLQAPVIIEQLYQNPEARMATVERLLELARREGVELTGLPGVRDALKAGAIGAESSVVDDDEADDSGFAALLNAEARKASEDDKKLANLDQLSRSEREEFLDADEDEEEADKKLKKLPLHAQVAEMSISEKVRLATIGSNEALDILVRDPNKLVHKAAVRSPRIQPPIIKRWAKNKSLPDAVIALIAANREWTRHYDVMVALVNNPKTPMAETLSLLNHIRTNDLKMLIRNRNVPGQVSRMAKGLYRKRTGG